MFNRTCATEITQDLSWNNKVMINLNGFQYEGAFTSRHLSHNTLFEKQKSNSIFSCTTKKTWNLKKNETSLFLTGL